MKYLFVVAIVLGSWTLIAENTQGQAGEEMPNRDIAMMATQTDNNETVFTKEYRDQRDSAQENYIKPSQDPDAAKEHMKYLREMDRHH